MFSIVIPSAQNSSEGSLVNGEMLFKEISYPELWLPLCSMEWNHLCSFGSGPYEEHFCEIILNLDQWFRRCRLKTLSRIVAVSSDLYYIIQITAVSYKQSTVHEDFVLARMVERAQLKFVGKMFNGNHSFES